MGGGSGGYYPSGGPSPGSHLESATSEEEEASYKTELNSHLGDILSTFNDRDIDGIRTHMETIEGALTKDDIGSIQLVYGGSVKKHTYVDGLSDVDILAKIENSELADASPKEVLKYFENRLREWLPYTEIKTGDLAVTVVFSDGHEIQILPALATKTGVRIANEDGSRWSSVIRPERFASELTKINQSNAGKVVPVVKLFKSINAQQEKPVKLTGYHIESLAIEAFREYDGGLSYKEMLSHLVQHSAQGVMKPIQDKTGQSIHVDDYLGEENSSNRQRIGATLGRIVSRMKVADEKASIEEWLEIVGE